MTIRTRFNGREFEARADGHGNVAYGGSAAEAQAVLQNELKHQQSMPLQARYRRATLTSELVSTKGRLYYNQKRQQSRW